MNFIFRRRKVPMFMKRRHTFKTVESTLLLTRNANMSKVTHYPLYEEYLITPTIRFASRIAQSRTEGLYGSGGAC
jgi:hypothetical protein